MVSAWLWANALPSAPGSTPLAWWAAAVVHAHVGRFRVGAVPRGIPAEQAEHRLGVHDRLGEPASGHRRTGGEEGAGRAPLPHGHQPGEGTAVGGREPLAGDEGLLDGDQHCCTHALGHGAERLDVGGLQGVGRGGAQQKAVLPLQRVLHPGGGGDGRASTPAAEDRHA